MSFRHGGASRGVEYNIRKKDKNDLYGFRFFKVTSSQKTVEDISFLPFYLAREDSPSRVRSGLHTEPLKLISCYKKRRKLFFGSFISIERSVQKNRTCRSPRRRRITPLPRRGGGGGWIGQVGLELLRAACSISEN